MGEGQIKDFLPLLQILKSSKSYKKNITSVVTYPFANGKWIDISFLPENLREKLLSIGIERLYPYQKRVYQAIKERKNVAIVSPTASGKTLSFHLPIIEFLEKGEKAIYVYPTKALTRDQERQLKRYSENVKFGIYDGDTPVPKRRILRRTSQVILTNPEMIHYSILPYHTSWNLFLSRTSFVVFDEAHLYSGIFGSNVSSLIRRMKRVFSFYGRKVNFIFSSATVSNPDEFFHKLLRENVEIITANESEKQKKTYIFIKPVEERSTYTETLWILEEIVKNGFRGICFMRSRKGVELMYRYLLNRLPEEYRNKIAPYRAGYSKETRREIERKLSTGEILLVVSTNALELGIDIGDLDVAVISGYPGTISSFLQESGRAGRRKPGYTILVAEKDPLNEYIIKHPEDVLEKPVERLVIDDENEIILKKHILCASFEIPITERDRNVFGPRLNEVVNKLKEDKRLKEIRGKFIPIESMPHRFVSLRNFDEDEFSLITEDGNLLEILDSWRAFSEAHPGAVYYHEGESFIVTNIDLNTREITLKPMEVPYYTQSLEISSVNIKNVYEEKTEHGIKIFFGEVEVTSRIIGYQKRQHFTNNLLGEVPLGLPERVFETQSLWFLIPEKIKEENKRRGGDFHGGIHALEHLLIGVFPLIAISDRKDIGGLSHPVHPDTMKPTIFIYDGYPEGIGFSKKGYENFSSLIKYGYEVVSKCPCKDGCPSCIYSPKCGNRNKPLDKKSAILILELILSML